MHSRNLLSACEFTAKNGECNEPPLSIYPSKKWPESYKENALRLKVEHFSNGQFNGIEFEDIFISTIAEPTDEFINVVNLGAIKLWTDAWLERANVREAAKKRYSSSSQSQPKQSPASIELIKFLSESEERTIRLKVLVDFAKALIDFCKEALSSTNESDEEISSKWTLIANEFNVNEMNALKERVNQILASRGINSIKKDKNDQKRVHTIQLNSDKSIAITNWESDIFGAKLGASFARRFLSIETCKKANF